MGTTVAINDILEALELATDESSSYVSSRTGVVLTLSHDDLRLAEEDSIDPMPDWQREAVARSRQVLDSDESIELPGKFDIHEWNIMDAFAASQPREPLREELLGAIRGRGAFRNSKSAIRRLGVEEAWLAYKRLAFEELARDWPADHGFSPSTKTARPGDTADARRPDVERERRARTHPRPPVTPHPERSGGTRPPTFQRSSGEFRRSERG
jgi:hypothetical protein